MGFASATRRTMLLAASLPLFASPALAQDEEEDHSGTIIITATVRQGGAQDVEHFRSIALEDINGQGLPNADSFTMEGLLGEHDLTLPTSDGCTQLFCIDTHVMPANIPAQEDDTQFLGISFATGVDGEAHRAEPLSLIAVVDRSGSMGGEPIARVKEALHAAVDQMRDGDRLGIVIYGSDTRVHQPVTDVSPDRTALHEMIDSIAINGSTFMEAGLRLGYATAFEELPRSNGRTRLMLFTDENPNVGDTSAEGFMGQAINGSRQGVGLTTIGVARHYDGALAARIASVRGGNLFFLPRDGSATELFESEFTNMVSEVAHDIAISIDPSPGYRVSGVFGVPDDYIERGGSGTVTVSIGSAFLSSNGGGIYATLEGDGRGDAPAMAEVSVAYTDAISQAREHDSESALAASDSPHPSLLKAQLLVDEYLGITDALAMYHERRDAAGAAEILGALSERIAASGLDGIKREQELVDGLFGRTNQLAGLGHNRTQPWELFGEWRVVRHRGVADLARGDRVEISEDGDFITERTNNRNTGEYIDQTFALNERQLHIEGTSLVLEYRVRGARLRLRDRLDGIEIVLERVS